ncbi:MAG: hypothetical protein HRT52_09200 [Colwellia sp.]|nr:hypothetical protein [Colwellia sp.]
MKRLEYKLLPCVFCTIGFNCCVAGHKMASMTYHKLSKKEETSLKPENTPVSIHK